MRATQVEVLVGKQKGEKRGPPRFVEQLAGYEKAIRKEPSLANCRVVKVLASQTCLPEAMLDEDYMKDIDLSRSCNLRVTYLSSLASPTTRGIPSNIHHRPVRTKRP